ncbi:MAG: hypothetical protein K6F71_15250 [Ruminococcus sp.]|uniref:hypothetical protein n=1 Tax=Ruminococcus sp. TaxID=41978 RepID=UPI0025DC5398|nr:hypothetical protein [Ruminococcus sp.]MCR5542163.1 hypothetical protein [Ruminococcus sp.]
MYVKGFDKIRQSEELSAAAVFVLWLIFGIGLILLTDKVIPSILTLMLSFGFIYPAGCLVMFFRLCKRHGVMWYFPTAVIIATVLLYTLWGTYRAIIPNLIVMTVLCLLFGCGIGSCFADKEAVRAYREQRRQKKLGEDKPYSSIIDDK